MIRSVIIGTGCYIPEQIVANKVFEHHQFYEADGSKLYKKSANIIRKFTEITGIRERRYASAEQNCSDLALISAQHALTSSGIDPETLDYIILAHNFGDVALQSNRVSQVPALASRVKSMLAIKNPDCVAYDLIFGCPGWIEGVIQADSYIRLGLAKRCMVIGAETLSRVIDPHDRDSMIYADGSGAVVLEASTTAHKGIIAHKTRTYATDYAHLLSMNSSYSDFTHDQKDKFLKMNGRKVYEFAITNVPVVMKEAIEKAGLQLKDIKKALVHQANDKMDQAILHRLFKLCNEDDPGDIMPMTIGWLGNSSVATVPTLLDLVSRGRLVGHEIGEGDHILLASVGAGMNINALVYKF